MLDPFIEYLRTRNRDAFDRAVALYSGPIHRLLGRVLPDSAVEETAQDVLFKLSELQKAPEELTAPRAFILRMALHEARDRARADRVRARHEVSPEHGELVASSTVRRRTCAPGRSRPT